MKIKCLCLCLLSFVPVMAQRMTLQGVPLSISYMDSQNMVDRGVIAIVFDDGSGRKRLVTGYINSRQAAAEIVAMVRAEINDDDQEVITIHCTQKRSIPENDRGYKPGALLEMITQLEVEGYKWNRRVWNP